jgi:hypothetical protein
MVVVKVVVGLLLGVVGFGALCVLTLWHLIGEVRRIENMDNEQTH